MLTETLTAQATGSGVMDTYVRKVLQQQGYILEDASTEEWNRLYDEGHNLLRGRYRGHTDRIADEFKFIGEQFDADTLNTRFAQSVNKLCSRSWQRREWQ